ncbi:protein kinase domain-containing protein [Sorangium sp. So ce131]|uniref:bifunctional serine/threonine-protein kinase/formylglycine-generating enzyme family protein n=1 Tax=Sorangium sp. So ce131 TaxID=3133282 RepID=UPI003F615AB5
MDSLIGSCIGQYRIDEEIGRGGMGVVYRAVHQGIGQLAAVKVLSSHFAGDASQLRRFENEARALSRVAHPGLVKIFDFGQTPRGEPYILMEYLRGELLRGRVARCKRLALPETLHIARQAASALAAVHRSGIVHRDVKPSNMMLVADDEAPGGERLKLLDFGIARLAGEGADLTAPGAVLGTALYMSPEQCAGDPLVDGRSDVYALGVVLYELLAGRPPFVGPSAEVLRLHLFQDARPLQEVAPELPRDIALLIGRMLAKAPSLRPEMAQVAEAMRRDGGQAATTPAAAPGPAAPVPAPPEGAPGLLDEAALRGATTRPRAPLRGKATPARDTELTRPEAPPRGNATPARDTELTRPEAPPRGNTTAARDTELTRPGTLPTPAAGLRAPEREAGRSGPDEPHTSAAPYAPWRRLRALVAGPRVLPGATAESPARRRRTGLLLGALTLPALFATAASGLFRGKSAASSGPVPESNDAPSGLPLAESGDGAIQLSGMVRLAGGKFRMGSTPAEIEAECQRLGAACTRALLDREQPAREVTVSPFYLDAHETTNADFAAWLDLLGPTLKVEKDTEHGIVRYVVHPAADASAPGILLVDVFPEYSDLVYKPGNHFAPRQGSERKPVVQVTWDAAALYCKARGKRLPTEAEWEFAARGAASRRFPWGEAPPRCDGVAFDRYDNGACQGISKGAQDVGTAPQDRTPEGVWDLGGNVEEWVQDQFLLPYYPACGDCIDPVVEAPATSPVDDVRVRRGGSWSLPETTSRGVSRGRLGRGNVLTGVGFRCASR